MGTLLEKKPLTDVTEEARAQAAKAGQASPMTNPAPGAPVAPQNPLPTSNPTVANAKANLISTYGSVEAATAAANKIKTGQFTGAEAETFNKATGLSDAASRLMKPAVQPATPPSTISPVKPVAPVAPAAPVVSSNAPATPAVKEAAATGTPTATSTISVNGQNVTLTDQEKTQYDAMSATDKMGFLNSKTGTNVGTPPKEPSYGDRFLNADGTPWTAQQVNEYVNKEVESAGVTDPTLKAGLQQDLMNSAFEEWNQSLTRHANELNEKSKLTEAESKRKLADLEDAKLVAEHQAELASTKAKYAQAIEAARTEYDTKKNNLGLVLKMLGGVQSQTAGDAVSSELNRAANNINTLTQQQDLDLIALAKGYEYASKAGEEYRKNLDTTVSQIQQYLSSKTEQGKLDTIDGINEAKAAINSIVNSAKTHGAGYAAALKQINDGFEQKRKDLDERRTIDASVSEKMGFLVNKFGEAVQDKDGNNIKIPAGIQNATWDKNSNSWLVINKNGAASSVKGMVGQPAMQDVMSWRSQVMDDPRGTMAALKDIEDPNMQRAVLRSLNNPSEFGLPENGATGYETTPTGLNIPAGSGEGTKLKAETAINTPSGVPYGECGRYANDALGTPNKFGNSLDSKVKATNIKPGEAQPTFGSGIVIDTGAKDPETGENNGHVGILVGADANNYFVKSANWVGQKDVETGQRVGAKQVSIVAIPKSDSRIKGFYDPTGGVPAQGQMAPVERATAEEHGFNPVEVAQFTKYMNDGTYPSAVKSSKSKMAEFENKYANWVAKDAPLTDAKQKQVNSLSDDYKNEQVVKDFAAVTPIVSDLKSYDPETMTNADDIRLIYEYAKLNDPGSAVREGEYATIPATTMSSLNKWGINAESIFYKGGSLTKGARAALIKSGLDKYESSKNAYNSIREQYAGRVKRTTGRDDADNYLTDYTAFEKMDDKKKPQAKSDFPETGDKNDPLGFPDLLK